MSDPKVPYLEALLERAPLPIAVQRFLVERYPARAYRLLRNAFVDLAIARSLLVRRPPAIHVEWLIRHSDRADLIDALVAAGECRDGALRCLVEHWRLSSAVQAALVASPGIGATSAQILLAGGLDPHYAQRLRARFGGERTTAACDAPAEGRTASTTCVRRRPPRRQHAGTARRDPMVTDYRSGRPRLFERAEVSAGNVLSDLLGDDPVAWETALELMPSFNGTCADLATVTLALCRGGTAMLRQAS